MYLRIFVSQHRSISSAKTDNVPGDVEVYGHEVGMGTVPDEAATGEGATAGQGTLVVFINA